MSHLSLNKAVPRRFLVSVSGGVDSTVLLRVLAQLRSIYPICLKVIHFNFQLRGRASLEDEKFVTQLCNDLGVDIEVKLFKKPSIKKAGNQEWARRQRLEALKVFENWELVEAHHGDDQLETLFLRLFRGVGPMGLAGMTSPSIRESLVVWRPLLGFQKKDLLAVAKKNKWKFRQDASNQKSHYDRNWVRLKLLPLIDRRHPGWRKRALATMSSVTEENKEKLAAVQADWNAAILESLPQIKLKWGYLRELSEARRKQFLAYVFSQKMGLMMGHQAISNMSRALGGGQPFAINARRGVVLRGFVRSRMKQEHILIDGVKVSESTNEDSTL